MPIEVDIAAISVMEFLGALSFFVAFLFFRQRQRIREKHRAFLDALERQVLSERGDGKCFSSEWVMGNVVYKPRRLLDATPVFLAAFAFLMGLFYFFVGPRLLVNFIGFGYATVVALVGIALLFWTDAFEAYGYSNAIQRVAMEQLDREDQSYIELAREALEKAFLRFFSLGVAFAVFGPFVPQVFDGVVYALMLYTAVFFQASEASWEGSAIVGVFGILIVMVLPGLMLFLPELLVRILIGRGKSRVRKLFRRKIEK